MPSNWRQATLMEHAEWSRWVKYFEGPVTKAVVSYYTAAGIAADTQTFLNRHKLSLPTGPIFTIDEETRVKSLLNAYNTIGRIVTGVHSAKYGIRLANGDLDVLAPPDMPKEEYESDLYTLAAVPLIIWAVVAGAVLVGGLWAGSSMMKSSAEKEFQKYKRDILKADRHMMKQPPEIRSDWMRRRKDFEGQIEKAKQETGFIVDIFGSKGGAWITAAVIALLALGATRLVPKGK